MLVVPVQALPAQQLSVILAGQTVDITLRQLVTGLFIDLAANGVEIVGLVLCQNQNRIVRDLYLGFAGDLFFYDNSGAGMDPEFTGLGTRYTLMYLEPSELPPGVG